MKGPGDFEAPAEMEGEPGPLWGDMQAIHDALLGSDFFKDQAAEIFADFITRGGDTYDRVKLARETLALADRCREHIDAKESEMMEKPE